MYVEIRKISAQNTALMEMLQYSTIKMIKILNAAGITLTDDCVKIWIKQYADDIFYPKIEFTTEHQELQYDMTDDGAIREVHYKAFSGGKGRIHRIDIAQEDLKPTLHLIDAIIRKTYGMPDT